MKILQICNFTSGISGVLTRALEDSREFIKQGHEVHIFSSNLQEDGNKVNNEEVLEGIQIKRFPVNNKIGYALWFDFEEEAKKLNPDIIICHGLRKPYLKPAIKVAKKMNAKIFLITHAPFIQDYLRSKSLNWVIKMYDKFYGKKILNSFDKVLSICKWEIPLLKELGCEEDRILYLPNALSEGFFLEEKKQEYKKLLYLGRMNRVKHLELLMKGFAELNLPKYVLEIVSSQDGEYFKELSKLKEELKSKIIFTPAIYSLEEKIPKIDSGEIFVLPSIKESLPFGIIESMSRGKIVIATNTKGGKEMILDGVNGFLFNVGDKEGLKDTIRKALSLKEEQKLAIISEAKRTAEKFRITNIMEKWNSIFYDEKIKG